MRLLHLSDPHFGTELPDVSAALQRWVATHRPALIMLGGDITQRARRRQFQAARDFLDGLQCPVIAVPGNHDIPLFNLAARIRSPYGNYQRAFGEQLEPALESNELLVIGVNSTTPRRHKNGELTAAQIERVRQRLARARPQQLRIVLQHHPVRAVERRDQANLAIGHEQAISAWVGAGLDVLLSGHIHLPYVLPLCGAAGRRGWAVQAGTALSHRVRGGVPNSFNVLDYDGTHCIAERWDYAAPADAFVCKQQHALPLAR